MRNNKGQVVPVVDPKVDSKADETEQLGTKQPAQLDVSGAGGNNDKLKAAAEKSNTTQPQHDAAKKKAGATSEEKLDNYIPLRLPDLRDKLIEGHPEVFTDKLVKEQFCTLCEQLSLRNKIRLARRYGEWQEKYAYLDPDVDVELPKPGSHLSREDKEAQTKVFEDTLWDVLEKGGFEKLEREDLDAAFAQRSDNGLQVTKPRPDRVDYKLFFRGPRTKEVKYWSWRTLFMERTMKVQTYQRLAISFHVLPQPEPSKNPFMKLFQNKKDVKVAAAKVNPEWLYLKMFRDIMQCDIDMLLPGCRAKFSWLDHLIIWGPVVFGVASAIYKSAQGTFDFTSMATTLQSVLLVALPLTWGLKAWQGLKDKEHDLEVHMNTIFLLHNLNNNSGVISSVLDEAQEQEDNEALLAFFFLWRGQTQPAAMAKDVLDKKVESYLNDIMAKQGLTIRIDFEVRDAIAKLRAMDILQELVTPDGHTTYQVCNLAGALAASDLQKLKSKAEEQAAYTGGEVADQWQEVAEPYPATGQRLRYFWNPATGQSTFDEPPHFKPAVQKVY